MTDARGDQVSSDADRLVQLHNALTVVAAARRKRPAVLRELDRMPLGRMAALLSNGGAGLPGGMMGRVLAKQHLMIAVLAGDLDASLSRTGRESLELARERAQSLELQRGGAPAEWADAWINRGSDDG